MPLIQRTEGYRMHVTTTRLKGQPEQRSVAQYAARYVEDSSPDRIRSRKGTGWLMPKPYSRSHLERFEANGSWAANVSGYDYYRRDGAFNGQVGSPTVNLSGFPTGLVSGAELEAMLMVKNQKTDLLVTVAEFGKSVDMVRDTATRFAKTLRDLRKGRFGSAGRHLGLSFGKNNRRDPRDVWLEHRYGWLPLMGDIKNQLDLITSLNEARFGVTGIGKTQDYDRSSSTSGGSEYPVIRSSVVNRYCKCRLDFLPANYFSSMARMAGISNPAALAWELMPLSFVYDWFVPVGDSLAILDYSHGLTFRSGSLTRFVKGTQSFSAGKPAPHIFLWEVSAAASGFDLKRSIYAKEPFPLIAPRPKMSLGIKQMLDGISLLKGATDRVLRV